MAAPNFKLRDDSGEAETWVPDHDPEESGSADFVRRGVITKVLADGSTLSHKTATKRREWRRAFSLSDSEKDDLEDFLDAVLPAAFQMRDETTTPSYVDVRLQGDVDYVPSQSQWRVTLDLVEDV